MSKLVLELGTQVRASRAPRVEGEECVLASTQRLPQTPAVTQDSRRQGQPFTA